MLLLFCGALMLVFTCRSLPVRQDESDKRRAALQLLLSSVFAALSGNMAACLIFCELRLQKAVRLILPPVMYLLLRVGGSVLSAGGFGAALRNSQLREDGTGGTPAVLLLRMLILLALTMLILLAERLVGNYLSARNETARVVAVTAVNELYEKKLNRELVMKNYLADKTARLEERENISRNIHNSVGHSITAAIMALDAADMLLDTAPEKAREKLEAANRRIHTSLDSIRQAVRMLDGESRLISAHDFICGLENLAESFRMDTALQIRMDASDIAPELSLPHEYGEFLTGAVSELLANGVRHGNADVFTIYISADSAHIRVSVLDNGTGDFSPQNARRKIESGYGLKKLISFAEKCGGSAVFENNHGFRSVITLPLYRESVKTERAESFVKEFLL